MLNQEIGWNLAHRPSTPLSTPADIIRNQFDQYLLKVLVDDGSTPGSYSGTTSATVPINMLEDGKAEPDDPVGALGRGRGAFRSQRAEHVMYSTDEQFVLIAEVCVKGRSADIGAIQDLLYGDRVIGFFANQADEGLVQ